MPSNHLLGQKSPYLIQHIDNPVDWYPWGEEAFKLSATQQKPILLSIGYSTCHWCHVMAHESFENQEIAKILNEHFISIKVDREERPDIDQIYMTAASMMTGQGGWPLTVFMTSEGKPFYAGTYFPPYPKWGAPGFIDVLNSVTQAWQNQREQLLASSEEITRVLSGQNQNVLNSDSELEIEILDKAFEQISNHFDRDNGGFGGSPKFPMGHQLSFLLRYYLSKKNENALFMVEQTLNAISKGGIYDHLGGGFHRYSTDAYWHIPHFEKMLYDQALLIKVYLECYQITGKSEYALIIKETLNYVLRDLTHPEGGFYTAEDADSIISGSDDKAEGAFYVWSQEEISKLLNQKQADIFNYIYGVRPGGNARVDPHGEFIALNILYIEHSLEQAADHFKLPLLEVVEIVKQAKNELFQHRTQRARPYLDDKVLADWNGLMIGVFAQAGCILNEPSYINSAKRAAEFVINKHYSNTRLLHSWCKNESSVEGMLNDYAFLINGLLDLYEANFDEKYFNKAKDLGEQMIILFSDDLNGGFYLTSNKATDLIVRPKDHYDGAIPSGNSGAVYGLIRLYHMTSEAKWSNSLKNTFHNFAPLINKSPSAYTFALCALDFYFNDSRSISIEGRLTDSKLAHLQRVVYKHYIPSKIMKFTQKDSELQVSVCYGNVCHQATTDLALIEEQLLNK